MFHPSIQIASDAAIHVNAPFVSFWLSAIEFQDILGRICGGLSTEELQSSLLLRLKSLMCVVDLVVSNKDYDYLRKQVILENGGSLSSQFITTLEMPTSTRLVSSSIVGFERPHAVSPLVTHVGPLIYDSNSSIELGSAGELHARVVRAFLDADGEGGAVRVIVLAFGSTAMPLEAMQEAFVRGIEPLLRERANLRVLISGSWRTKEFR